MCAAFVRCLGRGGWTVVSQGADTVGWEAVLFRSWSETIGVAKTRFFVSESACIGLAVVSGAYLIGLSHFPAFGVGAGYMWCVVHEDIAELMYSRCQEERCQVLLLAVASLNPWDGSRVGRESGA